MKNNFTFSASTFIFSYLLFYLIGLLVLSAQLCPTLCNPMDYSLPGSSVHGSLQARILEWIAISYSRIALLKMSSKYSIKKKKYSIKSHWESQYPFPTSMGKEELPSPTFLSMLTFFQGFPTGTSGKEPTCQCRRHKRYRFDPWILKIPWRRAQKPTPVFSPGESRGHRTWGLQSMGSQRVGHDWSDLAQHTQHGEHVLYLCSPVRLFHPHLSLNHSLSAPSLETHSLSRWASPSAGELRWSWKAPLPDGPAEY